LVSDFVQKSQISPSNLVSILKKLMQFGRFVKFIEANQWFFFYQNWHYDYVNRINKANYPY